MGVRIIVDSSADLAPQVRERITVIPLALRFGEEEYLDGINITNREFYEKLAVAKDLPTTSQATPFAIAAFFAEAVENGDDVVAVMLSSGLSGTYQSALMAAQEYEGRVFVVDSRNVTIGSAILAEYALRLADSGRSAPEIAKELETAREKIHLVAVVDTLEYLQRGGRVSKTAAVAGGLLSIKPVVAVVDGVIKVIAKGRGNRQANRLMEQEIEKYGVDETMPQMLAYSGNDDTLLRNYRQEHPRWDTDIPVSLVCGVLGAHVGPGAIAAAFFEKG